MKPETKSIKLAVIVTDAGTQVRVKTDEKKVAEYASDMADGDVFPAVDLFHDGATYLMADGFHRLLACQRNDFKDILATVHKGTKSDALKFALKANLKHGLKITNDDKRHAVKMSLAEWPTLSDREIAKICGFSDTFVGDVRKASGAVKPHVTGGDGRTYPVKPRKEKPTVEQFANAVAPKLSPASAPVAPLPEKTRDNSSAYVDAPPAKKERELTKGEAAAVDGLEVCIENAKYVLGQIKDGSYDPSESADLYKQFKDTMKLLSKLPKQEAK